MSTQLVHYSNVLHLNGFYHNRWRFSCLHVNWIRQLQIQVAIEQTGKFYTKLVSEPYQSESTIKFKVVPTLLQYLYFQENDAMYSN